MHENLVSFKQTKPKCSKMNSEGLINELEYLRMENEYLKKLNAFIQVKEALMKKTKCE